MSCKPTYKGKRYNSVKELLNKNNDVSEKIKKQFPELFIKSDLDFKNVDYFDFPLFKTIKLDSVKEVEDYIKSNNEQTSLDFAQTLSDKLNIPYEVISKEQMSELFPNQSSRKNFYAAGKVYLVEGAINDSSVFHEFSHPIIKALAKQNPELFNSLYQELLNTETGAKIISNLDSDSYYEKDSDEYKEEAIVMSLQNTFENTPAKDKGFFENLFFNIKQFLRKLLGKKINISKLNSKTTIRDFVDMINFGEEFVLDINYLNNDLMVMFETDYNNIIEKLKVQDAAEIQTIIDDMYSNVRDMSSAFRKKNDIYFDSAEDFQVELNDLYTSLKSLISNNPEWFQPLQKYKNITPEEVKKFNDKITGFVASIVKAKNLMNKFNERLNQIEQDLKSNTISLSDKKVANQVLVIEKFNNTWKQQLDKWNTTGETIFSQQANPMLREVYSELVDLVSKTNALSTEIKINLLVDKVYETLKEKLKIGDLEKKSKEEIENAPNKSTRDIRYEEFYGVTESENEEITDLELLGNLDLQQTKRLFELKNKSYSGFNLSKEQVKYILSVDNKSGGYIQNLTNKFQSYAESQNLGIVGFHALIAESYNLINAEAQDMETDLLNGLPELLKKAKLSDSLITGDGELGKKLANISQSYVEVNGKLEPYLQYEFKSNFINWEYDLKMLQKEVSSAESEYNFSNTPANEQNIYFAKKRLQKFKNDYMNQDYVKAVYELDDKYFSSPMGIKALKAKQDIIYEINVRNANIALDPSLDTKDLLYKLKELYKLHDQNGNKKTGDALEIAEILLEHSKESASFNEYKIDNEKFDNARIAYHDYLINDKKYIKDSDEYTAALEEWYRENTTVSIKPEYYELIGLIKENISYFLEEVDEFNNKGNIAQLYKDVFDILKPTKDSSNQYDVDMLNDASQIKIKDLSEELNKLNEAIIGVSGYSVEDLRKYRKIDDYFNETGTYQSAEDQEFHDYFFEERMQNFQSTFNLTTEDIANIKALIKTLKDLSHGRLSNNYLDKFTDLINLNKESQEYLATKIDMDIGDTPSAEELKLFLSNMPAVEELFKLNSSFKTWFENNHYVKIKDIFDEFGNFVTEQDVYAQALGWNFNIPKDLKHFNFYAVDGLPTPASFNRSGIITIDGVPRVPNSAYTNRVVKDIYKTEEIYEDYEDADGNLVLATKNNRGEWLPKDFTGITETGAADAKYIDKDYKYIFENKKDFYKVLDHFKKQYLKNQNGLDASQQLYLSYPRERISGAENYKKGNFISRQFKSIRDSWIPAADDADEGLFKFENNKVNPYISITRPIAGSYKIDIDLVSTNIISSMGYNAYSIVYFKNMRNISTYTTMFQEVVDLLANNPNIKTIEDMSSVKTILQKVENKNSKSTVLQNAVDAMIDKFQKGESLQSPTSLKVRASKVLNKMQNFAKRKSFSFDLIKSLTNMTGASSAIITKAAESNHFTLKTYADSWFITGQVISDYTLNLYSRKPQSLELQFVNMLDGIPNQLKSSIGKRGSQSLASAALEGEFRYFDRKILAYVPSLQLFFGIVKNKTFMVNGKKTNLLEQIELVDGKLQTKSGVPDEWKIGYDSSGNRFLGKNVKQIMNINQGLQEKTSGLTNELNESEAFRNIGAKYLFFLQKYFLKIAIDYWGFTMKNNRSSSRKISRRYNSNTGDMEMGRFISVASMAITFIKTLSNPTKLFKNKSYTKSQIRAFYSTAMYLFLYNLNIYITSMFGFDTDDDDDNYPDDDFVFDADNENNIRNLKLVTRPYDPIGGEVIFNDDTKGKGMSFDKRQWLKMQLLRLNIRTGKEIQTFGPDIAGPTGLKLLLLNSALEEGGFLGFTLDAYDILSGDKRWEQNAGIYYGEDTGDSKLWKLFLESQGVNGDWIFPPRGIEKDLRKY
jgi:hypothetical protein